MQDNGLEVIAGMLLHLSEDNPAGEVIFGVSEGAFSQFLNSSGADEGSTKLVGRIGALDHSAVWKFHSPLAFVPHRQRVEPWRDVEIVHA